MESLQILESLYRDSCKVNHVFNTAPLSIPTLLGPVQQIGQVSLVKTGWTSVTQEKGDASIPSDFDAQGTMEINVPFKR